MPTCSHWETLRVEPSVSTGLLCTESRGRILSEPSLADAFVLAATELEGLASWGSICSSAPSLGVTGGTLRAVGQSCPPRAEPPPDTGRWCEQPEVPAPTGALGVSGARVPGAALRQQLPGPGEENQKQ